MTELNWTRQAIRTIHAQHTPGQHIDQYPGRCPLCDYTRRPCDTQLLCEDWLTLHDATAPHYTATVTSQATTTGMTAFTGRPQDNTATVTSPATTTVHGPPTGHQPVTPTATRT